MPIVPVRGVGTVGAVPDKLSYDLPITGWSNVRNVRFEPEGAIRAPVLKELNLKPVLTTNPVYLADDSINLSSRSLVIVTRDGGIQRLSEGVYNDVSPTDTPWSIVTSQVTSTKLGSLTFLNHEGDQPLFWDRSGQTFKRFDETDHAWSSNSYCGSLRSYRDFLIALNVSKDGTAYPNMVKWSDTMQVGSVPNWDPALEGTNAGENVLNNSTGFLVDGAELRGSFMIYGSREVFRMDFVGGDFVFNTERVFTDFGAMSQNCIVETEEGHIVFGTDDIIVTDGITKKSICEGRTRKRIYEYIDYSRRNECHAIHDASRSEILFCYPSYHEDAARQGGEALSGCNEAAVFNYRNNTWSFYDLPGVASGIQLFPPEGAENSSTTTWAELLTWDQSRLSWNNSAGNTPPLLILAGSEGSDGQNEIYLFDEYESGRVANLEVPATMHPAFLEILLKDMDDFGLNIRSVKRLNAIYPQIETADPAAEISIQVDSSMSNIPSGSWEAHQMFSPYYGHKVNFRTQGRYIAIRFNIERETYARIGGYDLDIMKMAGR